MTQLDDKRIRFYLDHQDLIDTWASLAGETQEALTQWLLGLQTDVAELAGQLGAMSHVRDIDRWKMHSLAKPTWNQSLGDDPPVAIVMEWNSGTLKIPGKPPYIGIRLGGGGAAASERRSELLKRLTEPVQALGRYKLGASRSWWPAWRYIEPADEVWWDHLDEYHDLLISELSTTWADLAPLIDAWLDGTPPLKLSNV